MTHRKYLSRDQHFKEILPSLDVVVLEKQNKVYLRLCRSILSQQLSVKVARVLYQRFLDLFGGREPTVRQILAVPQDRLQEIGFSKAKSEYVHNVCNFFMEHKITDGKLHSMENDAVIDLLSAIKGVGRWTVEMILIFTLARPDVFPVDDLGIRNAMIRLYNIKVADKKKLRQRLIRISEKWSPYRTYASCYLWQWKDGGGI